MSMLAILLCQIVVNRSQASPGIVRSFREDGVVTLGDSATNFAGRIIYPVPPDDLCQEIEGVTAYVMVNGVKKPCVLASECSVLHQPYYYLDVKEPSDVRCVAEVKVKFFDTYWSKKGGNVPFKSLTAEERSYYLDCRWRNREQREFFQSWMTNNGLAMTAVETPELYARRILDFFSEKFHYVIPEKDPQYNEIKRREGDLGDTKYCLSGFVGECWRLSEIYDRLMRLNGIPSRLVSGNFVESSGHHIRSMIFLDGAGWIPIEATASVTLHHPESKFGTWGGNYLSGNTNINLDLEVAPGKFWNLPTVDLWDDYNPQGGFFGANHHRTMEFRRYAFPGFRGRILSSKQDFGGLRFNRELDGGPLRIGGLTFTSGLGTHANSRIVIELPPGVTKLTGMVGVTPNPQGRGEVVASVCSGDQTIIQSGLLRAGDHAVPFECNVAGLQSIELVIQKGSASIDYDHANWVNLDVR
jgi:transglutaminase-like putative cysteine protease